jgi:membrane protease YdiL (CAAX protease family)
MQTRLAAWLTLVGVYIALAYASRAAEGPPSKDTLYRYSTAVGGLVWYAISLVLVLLITRGPRRRELLALRRPRSLGRAVGLSLFVIVIVYAATAAVEPFLHGGEEQGLTPDSWEPSRAGQYAANFVVIAVVAPIVEELVFRGAGFSLLAPYGQGTAIVGVGILFGLVHGLLAGLVVLVVFGIALAWLRARTDSVYPGMVVHGLFNAIALVVSVTVST